MPARAARVPLQPPLVAPLPRHTNFPARQAPALAVVPKSVGNYLLSYCVKYNPKLKLFGIMSKYMSETTYLKRHWKLIVNILTVLALVVLVYAVRHQLEDTIRNFSKVNVWVLLLLLPIEWLNYHAQAKLYDGLFRAVGNKLSYRFLLETSLELNFVNSIFPSGGVSGISYFGIPIRSDKDKITLGRATLR